MANPVDVLVTLFDHVYIAASDDRTVLIACNYCALTRENQFTETRFPAAGDWVPAMLEHLREKHAGTVVAFCKTI